MEGVDHEGENQGPRRRDKFGWLPRCWRECVVTKVSGTAGRVDSPRRFVEHHARYCEVCIWTHHEPWTGINANMQSFYTFLYYGTLNSV